MAPRIVTLRIDGRDIGARDDETVLEVARENGIDIPTLCFLEGLSTVGACRLCLVEIGGGDRLLPACVTRVEEGMDVRTDTERLRDHRRSILELLFSERSHVCAVCVSNGFCELQSLAARLGMDQVEVPYRYPRFEIDATHPRFVHDPNRCILCSRCIRVCDEIEGAHTWDVAGRGVSARVVTDLDGRWGSSETCTSCGKCVQVCPTGALTEKGHAVAEMRKQSRFLPYLTAMREVRR